jgi:nucleotide-binding universal stress UspA family protein
MKSVLCATRGGEACRRTQEKAMDIAQQLGTDLIFLYAVDIGQAGPVDEVLEEPLRGEMARLGRALLRMAQSRARKRGMKAGATLLYGPFTESIRDYLKEQPASTLVLGAPRSGSAPQVFTSAGIQSFAEEISQETGMEVVVT